MRDRCTFSWPIPFLVLAAVAGAQSTARVSVTPAGVQAASSSFRAAITPDARFVAFQSYAGNLVAGDTNADSDVFLRDFTAGTLERVSVTNGGAQANQASSGPALSADGRFVAFSSSASNLVAGDTNANNDAFVRDRQAGTTVRVSVSSSGAQCSGAFATSISGDGRWIAFMSPDSAIAPGDNNGANSDVFLRDRISNTTARVSVNDAGVGADGPAAEGMLSADGRFVAFSSSATNLAAGTPSSSWCIFVRDLQASATEAINITSWGSIAGGYAQQPSISADGRYVAFASSSGLIFGDLNFKDDIYVRDRLSATTVRASHAPGGASSDGWCLQPAISSSGRFVAYHSNASDLVGGDTNGEWDVFVNDLQTGATTRECVSSAGVEPNGRSDYPAFAVDGRFVVFECSASNLVANDTNNAWDIFLRDRQPAPPVIYCTAKPNSLACLPAIGFTGAASASAGSGFVVRASNILNERQGLLFYSLLGSDAVPFQGGWRCVQLPTTRTALQSSGGNPAPANDCTGAFALDFNAYVASGADPALLPAQHVWAQYWSRDSASPSSTNLTDAIEFALGP
jgi:Tol biopolymer transport system component